MSTPPASGVVPRRLSFGCFQPFRAALTDVEEGDWRPSGSNGPARRILQRFRTALVSSGLFL
jgi:hypothetical protein